jgi:hypothetical protein
MKAIEMIREIESEIAHKHGMIRAIRDNCQHVWKPSYPKWLSASSPVCVECGSTKHGWWCEESPTKECDYMHGQGASARYDFDSCRYCGNPEERK